MNTKIKLIAYLFFSFITINIQAQNEKDKKQEKAFAVYINMLGESTYMYDKVILSGNGITYYNEKGKNIYVPHKYIKFMQANERVFMSVSPRFSNDGLKLMEVVAIGPEYTLLQYFNEMHFLFIYDKDFKMVMNNRFLSNKGSVGWKKNHENVLVDLKKYFSDCGDLMTRMRTNLDFDEGLTKEIFDLRCPDAPSYDTIVERLSKKPWYDEFIEEMEKKAKKKKK